MLQPIAHPYSPFDRACSALLFRFLNRIRRGRLVVTLPDGSSRAFGALSDGPAARLDVQDGSFFRRVLLHGDIGFGEAYVDGTWSSPDVTAVLSLFARNLDAANDRTIRMSRLSRWMNRRLHRARANTRDRSRRNIRDHYDLSNDFFRTFLDASMTYSSAVYADPEQSLEDAQLNKLRSVLRKADLKASDHLLEIGSGWGSLAIEAAQSIGCRVTSITLSQAQCELARERAQAAGVADRVDFRMCDYRDLEGSFDAIVSIEMLEAVGHEFLDDYFRACRRLLKPDGRAVIQVITIPHARYDAYLHGCDWVQKHIFPGGHLPSIEVVSESIARVGGLRMDPVQSIGLHYATTLREWRKRFLANLDRVRALGFDEAFCRKWEYYLCYCEAGFATRAIDTVHMVLEKSAGQRRR